MCHLCLTVTRMINGPSQTPTPQLMYEVLADQTMWAVCGRTAGVVSLETLEKQSVTLDVMPLTSGYLPLPVVRLSRYIPAAELKSGEKTNFFIRNLEDSFDFAFLNENKNKILFFSDVSRKTEVAGGPRLEPFSPGQVYNASKAQQVHVLPAAPLENN